MATTLCPNHTQQWLSSIGDLVYVVTNGLKSLCSRTRPISEYRLIMRLQSRFLACVHESNALLKENTVIKSANQHKVKAFVAHTEYIEMRLGSGKRGKIFGTFVVLAVSCQAVNSWGRELELIGLI